MVFYPGSPRADTFSGSSGADSLNGLASGDILRGLGGNDVISGDEGDDKLYGGDGNDSLYDGRAGDPFDAAPDNDFLDGGAGNDYLVHYQGSNGFQDKDELRGGTGNDTIVFNGAQTGCVADGGTGTDKFELNADSAGVYITSLFNGSSFVVQVNGVNTVSVRNMETMAAYTGRGADNLLGGSGADYLNSRGAVGGVDKINGGAGNDTVEFNIYSDFSMIGGVDLKGGTGRDHLIWWSDRQAGKTLYFDIENDIYKRNGVDLKVSGFESLFVVAYTGSATILGGDFADELSGAEGNDKLSGRGGNDKLFGTFGNDTLNGDAGNDNLGGCGGNDALNGGSGNDVLDGSYFNAAGETDRLNGGAGNDTFIIDDNDILTDSAGIDTITSNSIAKFDLRKFAFIENYIAGTPASIIGNKLANRIATTDNFASLDAQGLGGNDTLSGSTRADVLEGGAGNDKIDGGQGQFGEQAIDIASYKSASTAVTVRLTVKTIQDTKGAGKDTLKNIEGLTGSKHNDKLYGSNVANILEGGGGNDRLDAEGGKDSASYAGAAAGVTVSLARQGVAQNTIGAGSDTLFDFENLIGSEHADRLTGNGSANRLEGGAGNDILVGAGGNDVLWGGGGTDTLTGGAGKDVFLFGPLINSSFTTGYTINAAIAKDTITDFTLGSDLIHIQSFFGSRGALSTTQFHSVSAATDAAALALIEADDAVLYNKTTGSLFFDLDFSVSPSNTASFHFATITAGIDLKNTDIVIV